MAKKKNLTEKALWFTARLTVKGIKAGIKKAGKIRKSIKKAKIKGIKPVRKTRSKKK